MGTMISIKRVIVLLLVLSGSSHLTFSLSQVQDRRKAINQVAGIAFGTSRLWNSIDFSIGGSC